MLTDPHEIEIISNAKQKNIRAHNRSRKPFFNILDDFFSDVSLNGTYIDLGPGHFDLGEIIRQSGGICVGIDMDPAVVELGKYKGFECIQAKIQDLVEVPLGRKFDGIFNKFSLNAFWNWSNDDRHRALVQALVDMMRDGGWAWIGPWNGVQKKADIPPSTIQRTLDFQSALFRDQGFERIELSKEQAKRYGIHGAVANHVVFIKNLRWQPR